jgi:hypothetical protein
MKRIELIFSAILIGGCSVSMRQGGQKPSLKPEKVTSCQLASNPDVYNHKLVEVTGFLSHGFENFTLFDPSCSAQTSIWLEYGGTVTSGTVYCCPGSGDRRSRPKQLRVDNIPIPLVVDKRFRELDRLVQREPDSVVHATIVGRFFSGQQMVAGRRDFYGGYGHLGCCSLLAIQQVISVDPQRREDPDYGATPAGQASPDS